MLMSDNLLEALNNICEEEELKNDNDDYDLGEVLQFCYTEKPERLLRCSDSVARHMSFD